MPERKDLPVVFGNLLKFLPDRNQTDEMVETLSQTDGLRIERIVSSGQATPEGTWYDQTRDEWVAMLTGKARLQIEGEPSERILAPGDWLLLPAHCRHRVTWTSPDDHTVWLAVHFSGQ